MTTKDDGVMNSFDTGATRDTSEGKLVYDKFFSHAVLKQFAKYMNMNRLQSDGELRAGDNWQKGIPMEKYMESAYRHFMDFWAFHREKNYRDRDGDVEGIGAICGLLFNAMGWLHEHLKDHDEIDFDGSEPTFEMAERQLKVLNEKLSDTIENTPHPGMISLDEAVEQEIALTNDCPCPRCDNPNDIPNDVLDCERLTTCNECKDLDECMERNF